MQSEERRYPMIGDAGIKWSRGCWIFLYCWSMAICHGPLSAQSRKPPPAPVRAVPIEDRNVAQRQTFIGSAMAPRQSVVGSAVDARVMEVLVRAGDRVTAGQPIASLRTASLEIEAARAEAELELREQELAELENGSRPEEILQAQAQMTAASALAKYASARLGRTRESFDKGAVVSLDEMERAVSESVRAQQQLLAAQAAHQLVLKGPRAERVAQAKARVAVQVEQVRQIRDRIARHTLIAPFDAYVVAEHVEEGAWASRGQPVVEVAELDPIEVRVFVPESFVTFIGPNTPAEVIFDALPEEKFPGKVVRIVPQADLRSRTFPVKVQLSNPERRNGHVLKVGMFARVTLASDVPVAARMVPKDALVLNDDRTVVFVVEFTDSNQQKGTVRRVPVQLGVSDGTWIQVTGELESNQQVVVKGNEPLRPGQEVTVRP